MTRRKLKSLCLARASVSSADQGGGKRSGGTWWLRLPSGRACEVDPLPSRVLPFVIGIDGYLRRNPAKPVVDVPAPQIIHPAH